MQEVIQFFRNHHTIYEVFKLVFLCVLAAFAVALVLRLERRLYRRLLEKKNNINLRFVESIVRFAVIFLAVQGVIMGSSITESFGRTLFQGTAIIAAIAGFAAQPVISDMICGLMLSATKPFDIGDRIELEDGTAGVVKDITLRHVVIHEVDTADFIIPNSKLNGMKILNMSNQSERRSVHMRFSIAFTADIDVAMSAIARAVEESPCTVPGFPSGDELVYAPVHFLSYADSSLELMTTVYFQPPTTTEHTRSDVNTRVKRALDAAGVEIPYNYVNVIVKDEDRA